MAPPRKKKAAAAKKKPYDLKKAAETNRLALSPDEQWAEDICDRLDADYHPWQRDADADPSKRISLLWGRGVGKTAILRARALKKMVRRRGAAIAYVCSSRPTARRLNWNPLKRLLFELGISDEFTFHETRMECTCIRTGSVYYFIGADDVAEVEKLRGQPFDEVQIDECASHDNELLEYMLDECVAPRLGERDGVIVLAGTPGHVLRGIFYDATRPGSEFHRPYRERDDERWIGWSSHSCELLDIIELPDADRYPAMQKNWAAALEEKERKQWGDDNPKWLREYRRRWARNDTTNMYSAYQAFAEDGKTRLNSWDPLGGKKELDLVTMLKIAISKLPDDLSEWVFGYGQDLGARDPYALDIFALSPHDERRRKWHVGWFDARKMGPSKIANVLIGTEAADLARRGQVYTELGGAFGVTGWPVAIVADLAGLGETIIDELANEYGIKIKAAEKKGKFGAIEVMNGDFSDEQMFIIAGSPLEEQMQTLQWKPDEYGQPKEDKGARNDHADAATYIRTEIGGLFSASSKKSEKKPNEESAKPARTKDRDAKPATRADEWSDKPTRSRSDGEFDQLLTDNDFSSIDWGNG